MNRTEIVEKIEEFSRECAKTQYTDTGDVWALFNWIRDEVKRPEKLIRAERRRFSK